jgi:hypothetical protein
MSVFWDVGPCSYVDTDRRFRDAYCLHYQVKRRDDEGSKHLWSVGFYETTRRSIPKDSHLQGLFWLYSSPWEPDILREIPWLSWDPIVHYRNHSSPPLTSMLIHQVTSHPHVLLPYDPPMNVYVSSTVSSFNISDQKYACPHVLSVLCVLYAPPTSFHWLP